MHRQSLGSPLSKLVKDEQSTCQAQKQFPSQSMSSSSGLPYEDGDEEAKKTMIRVHNNNNNNSNNNNNNKPQAYIHLIPMLTLICFLILYLASHHPSQIDLDQFNLPAALSDSTELRMLMEVKTGDMVAKRGLKNLETEVGAAKHRLLHRKIAHF